MQLTDLRTLGRSGLPVSPIALGAMTFGNKAWGPSDDISEAIFNAYIDAGGNFIDTADVYSGGRSEELLGRFLADRKLRDRVVVATKFSFSGGNGRKNLHRALEGSLRRLATDFVDLFWMHVWDGVTPAEEMLQSMGDLVRAGKIRYFGLSDVPAWYATRLVTLAQAHNVPGPIALQLQYSLAERTIEQEHIPSAAELGLAIVPWSPLGFGLLSGKYTRAHDSSPTSGSGRLDLGGPMATVTERQWKIVENLRSVAQSTGEPMARIALAWVLRQPGITSTLIGARELDQLHANLTALDLTLPLDQWAILDRVSALDPASPYSIFSPEIRKGIFGGSTVTPWR